MLRICACLFSLVLGFADTAAYKDEVTFEQHGDQATLKVTMIRPLEAFASRFGGNAEDPFYRFPGDMADASLYNPGMRTGTLVPKRQTLEIEFAAAPDGSPRGDLRDVLEKVVAAENAQTPFAYRLDMDPDGFTFVPTRTRDATGKSVEAEPLLDRLVTIPWGTRQLRESAEIMAAELSKQTGLQVACCQAVVAGVPWGMAQVTFGSVNEPARSILKRLGLSRHPVRCDVSFCSITRN
jgi:hypothetical protein